MHMSDLQIKEQISSNPLYRKEIFSTDIYEAVLNHGVKDLKEFKSYLESIGKIL